MKNRERTTDEHNRNARTFPVTDFGAVGDGVADDTVALQRAIDACAAAGGGRVLLHNGRFLSGTLELRSHVELHLNATAVLLGSKNLADYRRDSKMPYRNLNRALGECKTFVLVEGTVSGGIHLDGNLLAPPSHSTGNPAEGNRND